MCITVLAKEFNQKSFKCKSKRTNTIDAKMVSRWHSEFIDDPVSALCQLEDRKLGDRNWHSISCCIRNSDSDSLTRDHVFHLSTCSNEFDHILCKGRSLKLRSTRWASETLHSATNCNLQIVTNDLQTVRTAWMKTIWILMMLSFDGKHPAGLQRTANEVWWENFKKEFAKLTASNSVRNSNLEC